ncbi:hypothetical protein D8Y23_14520 [Microbacterium enclense]|uniref:Uncharacterized protein n=1 Tax=Microbacterium enclense TaxID=993073 RepID=A0A3S3P1M6_9MICO|nr:hypothetical protein [Microbacterium enclense]RWR16047.1 hypothetical protein D8Y23_14520 [Microbacterium enclense]
MNRRRLRRSLGLLAPLLGVVVVLVVLHGAGVSLTVPGVLGVVLLLVVARLVIGLARGRRTDRE